MSVNRFTVVGTLMADGELKYSPTGLAILNAKLLVTDSYEKDNEQVTKEEELPLTIFGKLAEQVKREAAKGDEVYVEGKITNRKRENQKTGGMWDNLNLNVSYWRKVGGAPAAPKSVASAPRAASHSVSTKPEREDDLPF